MMRVKYALNTISAFMFMLVVIGGADGTYGAEAYLIPQLSHQISQPLALFDTRSDTRSDTLVHAKMMTNHSTGNQQDVTAPLHEVRQRFEAQLHDAQQSSAQMTGSTLSPKERAGYQLSNALATSDGFFIVSAHDNLNQDYKIFHITRQEAGDFILLADTAQQVRWHHFAQIIFDELHHIWPALSPAPITPLSYQWPVDGVVTFGQSGATQEMSGHLTASFLDHAGHLQLSKNDKRLSLSFSLAQWVTLSQFETDAILQYGETQYQAALLFAHTSLPDPAIWGQFHVPDDAAQRPAIHGYFSNFTLAQ